MFCHILSMIRTPANYRHGGVDTPQSKPITQNTTRQLTMVTIPSTRKDAIVVSDQHQPCHTTSATKSA